MVLKEKMMEKVMNKLTSWLMLLEQSSEPNFNECVDLLAEYFPLLKEFANTEQDNIWHAEGDVAIHTNMVLTELYQLLKNDAPHIFGIRRQALVLGALLHDIAKPLTTKRRIFDVSERVIAPRHEEIGRSYIALRLPELAISHDCCALIMGLVGYHQTPKLLAIKNQDKAAYLKLACNADVELLYWLEVADIKGRICDDLPSQLGYLEEYRMFCEDYGLWRASEPWKNCYQNIQVKDNTKAQIYLNNLAFDQLLKRQIYMPEEAIATTFEHANHYANLVITCGVSGSGKSSWIRQHLADFTVISLDEIRDEINGSRDNQKSRGQVLQIAKTRLKACLAKKQNVVWDATNIRRDFREILCTFGRNYHALITVVAFQLPISHIQRNNVVRDNLVPEDILLKQIRQLEWPEFDEGHRLVTLGEKGKLLGLQGSFEISDKQVQFC
jgi:predicted kinase